MTLSRKPLVLLFAPFFLLTLACGQSPDAGDAGDAAGSARGGVTSDLTSDMTSDLTSDLTSDVTTTDLTSDPGGEVTPPPQPVFVRPNMKDLAPDGPEIAAFRNGVKAMRARPATDPTSWAYQAAIHGTYDPADREAWNTCQHGSYFFFSWHRMYVYYFERILRKASGDPNFALPFWDYTDPAQRALPAVLRQPADPAQNPLFVAERNPPANGGAQLPASAVAFDRAMAFTNFSSPAGSALSFGGQTAPGPQHFDSPHGQLESQPHDIIHVLVGGSDGWMSDPNTAAQDPVFWLHHANIDRLWNVWIAKGEGRQNPTGQPWLTQTFVFFDENGQRVEMTGQQILDTAQQLNYRYAEGSGDEPGLQGLGENHPKATFTDNRRDVLVDKAAPTRLTRTRASVSIQVPAAEPEAVGDENRRLALIIEGIKFGRPGVYYEVYANLPQGTQPNPSSPHYVGNIAVFGQLDGGRSAHAGHARGRGQQEDAALAFEVTELIERLRGQPGFTGNLTLQFVPRGMEGGQARSGAGPVREVRFERIKLVRE
jgi:tyrosinase